MDINVYQPCPCHADQKIKFCCGKEIVNDLNQILTLSRGKQSVAALDKIERVIAEKGERDCLMTLKSHILINLYEIDKAKECNQQFLKKNPNHPIGLQHQALIFLADGEIHQAINSLQDAMDAIKDDAVPISISNTFRMVGMSLIQAGYATAGRMHINFAQQLRGGEDETLQQIVLESFRIPTSSILFKFDPVIPESPDDEPWSKGFKQVRRLAARGQWRTALAYLQKKLLNEFDDVPELYKTAAVLSSWIGSDEESGQFWRKRANCSNLSMNEAIEAEACAQLLDSTPPSPMLDIVKATWPVTNMEQLLETISSNERLVGLQYLRRFSPPEDMPPPKTAFGVLDRESFVIPEDNKDDDLPVERIPKTVAEVLVYGRQTDMPARVELFAAKNEDFDSSSDYLKTVLAECVDFDKPEIQVIDQIPLVSEVVTWSWHLPTGISRAQHAQIMREMRQAKLLKHWVNCSMRDLDNKKPSEVIGDPKYRLQLQAMISHMENSSDQRSFSDEDIAMLRDYLKLEHPEPIDPDSVNLSELSPALRRRLQWENLDDKQLLQLYVQALAIGNWPVVRGVGPEMLNRNSLEEELPFENIYASLARIEPDEDESLELIRKARSYATRKNRSQGIWLVQELEIRLERGIVDKCKELLETIQTRHISEPDVENQLVHVLTRFGLLSDGSTQPDGVPAGMPPESQAEPEIWTPDSDAGSGESSGESKLWLPGQ